MSARGRCPPAAVCRHKKASFLPSLLHLQVSSRVGCVVIFFGSDCSGVATGLS